MRFETYVVYLFYRFDVVFERENKIQIQMESVCRRVTSLHSKWVLELLVENGYKRYLFYFYFLTFGNGF